MLEFRVTSTDFCHPSKTNICPLVYKLIVCPSLLFKLLPPFLALRLKEEKSLKIALITLTSYLFNAWEALKVKFNQNN